MCAKTWHATTASSVFPLCTSRFSPRFAGAGAPSLASGEEAGDIEIAHAVARKATIRVVLTTATGNESYIRALQYAIGQGAVISITAGLAETSSLPPV